LHRFKVIAQYWSYFCISQDVPLFNALVLDNLCEYHYVSYVVKNYILFATFHRRQYGSKFNQFDVVGSQIYRIRWNNAK